MITIGTLVTLIVLLIAYQVKHFLCDYPLQTPYMLGKFKGGDEWVWPLAAHAGVHAFGTLLIVGCVALVSPVEMGLALAAIDFMAHFIIDRLKVLKGNYPQTDKKFWWALGLDQMAHHLTHYAFIITLTVRLFM